MPRSKCLFTKNSWYIFVLTSDDCVGGELTDSKKSRSVNVDTCVSATPYNARATHVLHLFALGKWCWRETYSLFANLKFSAYKRCLPTFILSFSRTRRKDTNLALLDVKLQSLLWIICISSNLKAFSLALGPTLSSVYGTFGIRFLRVERSECVVGQSSPSYCRHQACTGLYLRLPIPFQGVVFNETFKT